jgi:hypothetical protein
MSMETETRDTLAASLETPIVSSDTVSLADACRLLPPRKGKQPTIRTVRGWVAVGVIGKAGNRVRLKAFRIGRPWYTTMSFIRDFIVACTDGLDLSGDALSPVNPSRPPGGISEARRRLIARGMHGSKKKKQLLGK